MADDNNIQSSDTLTEEELLMLSSLSGAQSSPQNNNPAANLAKDLLTEEEISALTSIKQKPAIPSAGEKRQRVVPYNFRRPNRVSKEQVRSLYLLHDTFAHNLSSSLPIFLRAISDVTLISVEQQAYVEYLYGLPNPTAIFTLGMNPLQGMAVLEMNPTVAFTVIDRQLGGPGQPLAQVRPVTEIEQKILEGFLKIVIDDLRTAWQPILDLDFHIMGSETCPQLLQIVAPNEVVISVIFHVRIADVRGTMSFCIPAITLEPIIQKFNQSFYSRIHDVPPEQTLAIFDHLSTANFSVAAELHGTTMTLNDLMKMSAGDVLRLNHRADRPVDVSVGGQVKYQADLVAHDKHMAVHLREMVNVRDKHPHMSNANGLHKAS